MESDIGKMARLHDVWFEILDIRTLDNGEVDYRLYSLEHWIPKRWIKEIRAKSEM